MYFSISGYSRARTLTLKVRNSHVLAVNLRRRLDLESIHWDSSESNRTRIRVSDDFDTFFPVQFIDCASLAHNEGTPLVSPEKTAERKILIAW